MVRRRVRPLGGGIPSGMPRRIPGSGDVAAAADRLRDVAKRLDPINERLDEVREEIVDRLVAAGAVDGVRELSIEVFDEGDEVVAIAELPGFTESEIALTLDDHELTIDGVKPGRHFSGSVSLPADVSAGWVVTTRNGVVEVRFRKRKGADS